MAEKDKSDELDLLEDAKEKFSNCENHYSQLYRAGQTDQEFLYGIGQWDERDVAKRDKERRPALVLNQLLPYAHQVINDIKQARPAIRVSPVDSGADVETAEVFQGIIRNIESQSNANVAYDTAAMNSVGAGIGWIRIETDYCDPLSFDQEISISRVLNFQSVYIDPQSVELDGSDAEYAFVFDDITKEEFEERYPDAEATSFAAPDDKWVSEDTVRVAEYFYREYDEREIYKTDRGVITKAEADLLEESGEVFEVTDKRMSRFPVIKHCVLSGAEILEEHEWVGRYIPLVMVVGEESWINGRREFHSLIRQAKDAQRAYNYWKTASTEFIALQQKAPYTGPLGSFRTYPEEWASANSENYAFLEYDIVHDENGQRVEPPSRQPPVTGSPAMMQEAMGASQDIRNALGMYEASMGMQGSEISGIAVRNRQIYGDNANFHFMDNLSASISHVGRILVDLIPRIYSKRKIARILGEDGKEEIVPINQSYKVDEDTGVKRPLEVGEQADGIYDLRAGKYDVVCDVGASYSSKRQEMADKLVELTKARPDLMDIAGDIFFDVLDMPGGKEISERIRSQMPPEFLGDDPMTAKLQAAGEAMGQLQQRLQEYELALSEKAKNEEFEQDTELAKLELEREKLAIDAQKAKADIDKIYAEIRGENADTVNQTQKNMQILAQTTMDLTAKVEDLGASMNLIIQDMEDELNEQEAATVEPVQSAVMPEEGVND